MGANPISLTLVPLIVLAVQWPHPGLALVLKDEQTIIEEKCEAVWPDNVRMRAACVEQQEKVLDKAMSNQIDPRLPLEDLSLLRDKCAHDWPDDFRMRARCEQNQIRGFQRLQSPPPKDVSLRD